MLNMNCLSYCVPKNVFILCLPLSDHPRFKIIPSQNFASIEKIFLGSSVDKKVQCHVDSYSFTENVFLFLLRRS